MVVITVAPGQQKVKLCSVSLVYGNKGRGSVKGIRGALLRDWGPNWPAYSSKLLTCRFAFAIQLSLCGIKKNIKIF